MFWVSEKNNLGGCNLSGGDSSKKPAVSCEITYAWRAVR